jgi:hypothetical protein
MGMVAQFYDALLSQKMTGSASFARRLPDIKVIDCETYLQETGDGKNPRRDCR